MSEKVKDLLNKADTLKSNRSNFDTEYQNVANIFRPTKANIITTKANGDKSDIRKLYDSYPINVVATLKSIVIGLVFNRSIKPIALVSNDEEVNEDPEAALWLTDFTNMMLKTMFDPKSGFERSLSEAVSDDIVFGTIATLIEKGSKYPIKYHTQSIGDFYIAESKDGDVDYVVLYSKKTARQIVEEWGEKAEKGEATIHENITNAAKSDPFKEFEMQLHVLPRQKRDEKKLDRENKEIAGFWIDTVNKTIVEETGWDTMPIAVGRSEKASDEIYGTSRAMIALASANQSNEMWRQLDDAAEYALKPAYNINANYSKRLNIKPGALNYPDQDSASFKLGRPSVEPINIVGNIAATEGLIMLVKEVIKDIFFIDKLKVMDNPNATATQVLELRAEGFRIMGDFVTGLIEYLNNTLDRTFSLLYSQIYDLNNQLIPNNGLFKKELPEKLKENPGLKVEYINPIAQSQRLNESTTIDKWLQDVANIAQFKPEVLDLIKTDEIVRSKRILLNIDPELVNSKIQVKMMREKRQAAVEQQQQLDQEQQAVDIAETAKNAQL